MLCRGRSYTGRLQAGQLAAFNVAVERVARAMYAIIRLKAALKAWYWAVHFKRRGKLYYKLFYREACLAGKTGDSRSLHPRFVPSSI